jgi:valyl-tRNA synthetase
MMDKYGTDALRFALMAQAHPGKDIPFDEQSVVGARNFVNKVWNSTRFVMMNLPDAAPAGGYRLENLSRERLELCDRWILSRYQGALAKAGAHLDAYEPAAAAEALYAFVWDEFCAWYIELAKNRLQGADGADRETVRTILVQVLAGSLKALLPIMPFVTEEIYASLKPYAGETAEFVLKGGYHAVGAEWTDAAAEKEMALVKGAVTAIRSLRAQLGVPLSLKIPAFADGPFAAKILKEHRAYVGSLAGLSGIEPFTARPAQSATAVADGVTFYVPLAGIIDLAKERERLGKELAKAAADIEKCGAKLKNLSASASVPAEKAAQARAQLDAAASRRSQLEETLKWLD